MKLANIHCFISVAETGSFSETAERLNLTQPAVSLSIKSLENEFGVKLIERRREKCELTDEGRHLIRFAKDIADAETRIRNAVIKLRGETAGKLKVVSSNIPGEYLLPGIAGDFKKRYPKVELHIDISDSNDVVDLVLSCKYEVGFIGREPNNSELAAISFFPDLLVIVGPSLREAAIKKRPSCKDLEQMQWVLRERGSATRALMLKTLESYGVKISELEIAAELGSTSSVISALESGLGFSMVSVWAVRKAVAEGRLTAINPKNLFAERDFYMIYRADATLSAGAEALLDYIESKADRLRQDALKSMKI